jgi:D-alanine-D-alanine ligase
VKTPIVAVLCGGTSAEREVSLRSGRAVAAAAAGHFPTRLCTVDTAALPPDLDPAVHVVLSTLHGTFGEDGGMQRLLEAAGIAYAGCDARASALTMDKAATKACVARLGVPVAEGVVFDAAAAPTAAELSHRLGREIILKPNHEGSSVGLEVCLDPEALAAALARLRPGRWLAERRIRGTELTVGLLHGRAMGVVEIAPRSGTYDYTSKYTRGATEYFAPARIAPGVAEALQRFSETAFAACDCRDFARIDFMLSTEGQPCFLEINTLPGMTETSLLPKSASCRGLDFAALVREMVQPAVTRFRQPPTPLSHG